MPRGLPSWRERESAQAIGEDERYWPSRHRHRVGRAIRVTAATECRLRTDDDARLSYCRAFIGRLASGRARIYLMPRCSAFAFLELYFLSWPRSPASARRGRHASLRRAKRHLRLYLSEVYFTARLRGFWPDAPDEITRHRRTAASRLLWRRNCRISRWCLSPSAVAPRDMPIAPIALSYRLPRHSRAAVAGMSRSSGDAAGRPPAARISKSSYIAAV